MDLSFSDLAKQCAPTIATETLAAVATVESGLNPFAIRMTSGKAAAPQPATKAEAIERATILMVEGQSMDLGLGGLRSSDLADLRMTVTEAFDPCLNIAATGRLLEREWRASAEAGLTGEKPIRRTLAAYYGGGDIEAGHTAGYDRQVLAQIGRLDGKLDDLKLIVSPELPSRGAATDAPENSAGPVPEAVAERRGSGLPRHELPSPNQRQQAVDVFSRSHRSSIFVFPDR